jgi:hypothetical protein
VIEAKPGTCRYPLGTGSNDLRYCGAPATVVAAGVMTYCAGCAAIMYAQRG